MSHFTPMPALFGGVLIGLGAFILLLGLGRIAGISGIVGGLLQPVRNDTSWRFAFVIGLLAGGALLHIILPTAFGGAVERSLGALIAAGLLVGFGTRLGYGCTSGHGVCGISRLSPRSIVATLSFMAAGAAAVYVVNHVLGSKL